MTQPQLYAISVSHASFSNARFFIINGMKMQFSPGRLRLLLLMTFLPTFIVAGATHPIFVVSTATPSVSVAPTVGTPPVAKIPRTEPYIDSFVIRSDIQFRYSRTQVRSVVVNPSASKSHEVTFNVTLPDTAFISKFSMIIKDKTWEAMVAKQDEARQVYEDAVNANKSAGLIEIRSANVFTVRNNVEPSESITFTLTYEELLQRRFDVYEQAIHIDSDEVQAADIESVTVTVTDSQNIVLLRAIARDEEDISDKEIDNVIVRLDGNIGLMTWSRSTESSAVKIPKRIILQYDVRPHPRAGQVLVRDGHFVHFFSPQTSVQPKHIVFVLDVSGSMSGTKMRQLKEAMTSILKELYANSKKDLFSIVVFHDSVHVWKGLSTKRPGSRSLVVFPATERNINAATSYIDSLSAVGMTNIHDALITALNVAAVKTSQHHRKPDPIIMFLTDGNATEGVRNMDEIQSKIKAANQVQKVPIFCLGFGNDVEFPFLRKLSLQNGAMARRIYEASDAALQLQNFYSEIASPALSNVNLTYTSDLFEATNITRTKFSRFFKGSEIVVAGKVETDVEELKDPCKAYCVNGNFIPPANITSSAAELNGTDAPTKVFEVAVSGSSAWGVTIVDSADIVLCDNRTTSASDAYDVEDLYPPSVNESFMERLWAHLTIKQLLEQTEADDITPLQVGATDAKNPAQRALDLALRYEFVTPLTSLVVVRPDFSVSKASLQSKGYEKLLKGLKETRGLVGTISVGSTATIIAPDQCGVRRLPAVSDNATEGSLSAKSLFRTETSTLLPHTSSDYDNSADSASPQPPLGLTIDDIYWLSADVDQIEMENGTGIFRIARDGQAELAPLDGASCHSGSGICTHLKYCVMKDFIYEFEVYMEDYFCEIGASAGYSYAGACCPGMHEITSVTTTTVPHFGARSSPLSQPNTYRHQ